MKIELIYEAMVVEEQNILPWESDQPHNLVVQGRQLHKSYECDVLDRDMIDSPKGKKVERFIIHDLQITQKSDVPLVIEMLENVKQNLT